MTILNMHKLPGKQVPAGAVYIGRGSRWGNPYVIGKDGTRQEVIDKYEARLQTLLADPKNLLKYELAELDGKDLVCFCAPQACHGDVLARYAQDAAQYYAFHPEDRPNGLPR